MLTNLDRNRRSNYQPWSERTGQQSESDSNSLVVVCAFSLIGLTFSLFSLAPAGMIDVLSSRSPVLFLGATIMASAICVVVIFAGRSNENE
jgi:hypothetical protein